MKATIGIKIFAGYAVALAAISLLLFGAIRAIHAVESALSSEVKIRGLVDALEDTEDFFVAARRALQAYLITRDPERLEELDLAKAGADEKFETIRVTAAAAGATIDLDRLRTVGNALLDELDSAAQAAPSTESNSTSVALVADQSVLQIEELERVIQQIQDHENGRVDEISEDAVEAGYELRSFIINGSVIAIVAVLIAAWLVTRNISAPIVELEKIAARIAAGDLSTKPGSSIRGDEIGSLSRSFAGMVTALQQLIAQVQRSGVQVNSASVEISATAKQQQTTAAEVASTTTEVGATAKEMSATSSELLKTVEGVSVVAEQASHLAETGKAGLHTMETTMRGILNAAGAITSKLGVMNEKAGNINAVVTTITKVADQTNLLSLNAAIEAEKAGEYGRGFSVVAAEIRRLADQTAASTSDIELMVKEMVSAVSSGVMGMDKFAEELRRGASEIAGVGAQLDRIISEVQSLAPSIETVNEGMRSQATGARQISDALAQLGDAARMTSDSIRESARAIDQLNEATQGLQGGIAKFKLSDG